MSELTGDFDAALFPLLVFLSVLVAVLGGTDLLEGLRSLILDLKLFVIPLLHEKDGHVRFSIGQRWRTKIKCYHFNSPHLI